VPPPPTSRLEFRTWRESDLALAIALWDDPRVTEKIGAQDPRERLTKEIACERDHGISYWPIFENGAHAGACGLRPREGSILELGFHLRPEFWGRGLASEAARAVITYAWTRGASSLFAGHHPENASSRALLEKLGFVHTHDELYAPTGRLHPSYRLNPETPWPIPNA
jgi:ribosomal-protein-alanine N-acetyltransferase